MMNYTVNKFLYITEIIYLSKVGFAFDTLTVYEHYNQNSTEFFRILLIFENFKTVNMSNLDGFTVFTLLFPVPLIARSQRLFYTLRSLKYRLKVWT